MKKTDLFRMLLLGGIMAFGLGSCQKDGANPSTNGTAAAKANLTVGLPPVLSVWVREPAIPYTDQFPGDKPIENQYVRGFTINGYGYALGTLLTSSTEELNNVTNDLWQWDATANSWSKKASFPGNALYLEFGASFVVGDNAYVYTVDNHFYQYNQPSDSWTTLPPPPGKIDRVNASSFGVNGKGYFGMGMNDGGGTVMSDFLQFDPMTKTWTFMHTFPGTPREGASCFAIDGKGYVVGGRTSTTSSIAVWQYDPTVDHWTQMKNFPGSGTHQYMAATGVGTVQGNDVGFTASISQVWQYSPGFDNWVQLTGFPGAQNAPGGFVIQNGFYICSIGCVAYKWYN